MEFYRVIKSLQEITWDYQAHVHNQYLQYLLVDNKHLKNDTHEFWTMLSMTADYSYPSMAPGYVGGWAKIERLNETFR